MIFCYNHDDNNNENWTTCGRDETTAESLSMTKLRIGYDFLNLPIKIIALNDKSWTSKFKPQRKCNFNICESA